MVTTGASELAARADQALTHLCGVVERGEPIEPAHVATAQALHEIGKLPPPVAAYLHGCMAQQRAHMLVPATTPCLREVTPAESSHSQGAGTDRQTAPPVHTVSQEQRDSRQQ